MDDLVKGFTSALNAEGIGFFLAFFTIWVVLSLIEWRPEDVAARIQGDTTSG